MTDGQSASLSWFQAPSGAWDQIFVTVGQLRVCTKPLETHNQYFFFSNEHLQL
jgi:hypothetical protein